MSSVKSASVESLSALIANATLPTGKRCETSCDEFTNRIFKIASSEISKTEIAKSLPQKFCDDIVFALGSEVWASLKEFHEKQEFEVWVIQKLKKLLVAELKRVAQLSQFPTNNLKAEEGFQRFLSLQETAELAQNTIDSIEFCLKALAPNHREVLEIRYFSSDLENVDACEFFEGDLDEFRETLAKAEQEFERTYVFSPDESEF